MRPVLLSLSLMGVLSGCGQPADDSGATDVLVDVRIGPITPPPVGCVDGDWFLDADGDGFGDTERALTACVPPEGYVAPSGDCDDADAATHPRALESCDEIDNDCNGRVDDGVGELWYADIDADGFGDISRAVRDCFAPPEMVDNGDDCDDRDVQVYPGALEWCDSVDNDCNHVADDDALDQTEWFADDDGDGVGSVFGSRRACERPTGFVDVTGDCDDGLALVNPNAPESCDGLDNNCDGAWDEPGALGSLTWHPDRDRDGFGDASESMQACTASPGWVSDGGDCDDTRADVTPAALWFADLDGDAHGDPIATRASCEQPFGFVAVDDDCDDTDAATHPGAEERCDGLDQDCDGVADEGAIDRSRWFADRDNDGHGDALVFELECFATAGRVAVADDCDDADSASFPGAAEQCDGRDNDCNGLADDGDPVSDRVWFYDADGDGFGSAVDTLSACAVPEGYVVSGDDCDDGDARAFPGAPWYRDADGDGFGVPIDAAYACEPPVGYVADPLDCNDAEVAVFPGALERCDDLDNNCDSIIDNPDAIDAAPLYADGDGDGYGGGAVLAMSCRADYPFTFDNSDCDDARADMHPGATDYCDGVDRNCDGVANGADAWWDPRWPHRLPLDVTSPSGSIASAPVALELDFARALDELGLAGALFDPASVRVVELDCGASDRERPSQFEDGVIGFGQRVSSDDVLGDGYGTLFFHAGRRGQLAAPLTTTRFAIYFATVADAVGPAAYPVGVTSTAAVLSNDLVEVGFNEAKGALLDRIVLRTAGGPSPSLLSQASALNGNGFYTPSGPLLAQAGAGVLTPLASGSVVAGVRAAGYRANNDGALSYEYEYWLFADRADVWTKTTLTAALPTTIYHVGDWTGGVRPWQTRHDQLKYTDTEYDVGDGTAFVGWGGWGVRWGFAAGPAFHYATSAANGNVWEQSNDFEAPGFGLTREIAADRNLVDHSIGLIVPVSGPKAQADADFAALVEGVAVFEYDPESR